MRKLIATLAVGIAAIAGVTLAPAAPAEARNAPAQAIAVSGNRFWVKTGQCSGNIRVNLYTDARRPGRVTVKLTPSRFTRQCTVRPWFGWGMMGVDQIRIPVTSGPSGGKSVTRTYRTGPGVMVIAAGHRASLSAVQFYTYVPF